MRKKVFKHFHVFSKQGRKPSLKQISDRFVWPNISSDIKHWTQTCLKCQRSKIHRHTKCPTGQFPKPDRRFTHLHVDIVGPLPEVNGYPYLLTIVDRFTRWPVVVPLRDTSAETVAKSILGEWISIFGCPSVITTDRSPQFQPILFTEFVNLLGVKHILYHCLSPMR